MIGAAYVRQLNHTHRVFLVLQEAFVGQCRTAITTQGDKVEAWSAFNHSQEADSSYTKVVRRGVLEALRPLLGVSAALCRMRCLLTSTSIRFGMRKTKVSSAWSLPP